MERKHSLTVLVLAIGLTLGCVRQPMVPSSVSGVDRKLSTFAYIEEGKLVTLIVDTQPARDRLDQKFLGLEVALANNGLKRLHLSRESFVLVDEEGRRYPLASPRELYEGYEFRDMDRGLAELEGILFSKFAAYQRYPSNFSPTLGIEEAPVQTVRDRVVLPRFGYFIDFLYFPTPPGLQRGEPLELFVQSPDLEDPVFVKFEIR